MKEKDNKNIEIKNSEEIDDLQYKGLRVIQDKNGFKFGVDSVLLSDFAKEIKDNSKVVDLGTGTGVIGILLCGKTKLSHIVGIEIQEEVSKMAQRSIELNKLEEKFKIINMDINDITEKNILRRGSFDAVVMNPPYKEKGTGIINEENKKIISRHETTATLEDFIKTARYLLNEKGEIYIVHKPERLVDVISLLRENKIEPKRIRFIYSSER